MMGTLNAILPIMTAIRTQMAAPGPAGEAAGSLVAAKSTRRVTVYLVAVCGIAQALSLIAEIGSHSVGSNRAA